MTNAVLKYRKPVLVTGGPRCGTTLIGTILAFSSETAYIYEPFNINQARGTCRARFPYWFTYIDDFNGDQYREALESSLSFSYNLWGQVFWTRRPKDLLRLPTDWKEFARGRRDECRPVMKDPIAILSAEWLAREFDMDVVVMVRHPAGFVNSRKVRGDTHDFRDFSEQKELMNGPLAPFRDEVNAFVDEARTEVEQSALLWKLLYHCVAAYRDAHPNWVFVRLEDLSNDPRGDFRRIFEGVGIPFTERIEQKVTEYSSDTNRKNVRRIGKFAGRTLKRNSKASAGGWRKSLTAEEIESVRRITGGVWERFYSEDEWY